MAIKPILFSTPMVQAIMDGRKTMTRRVIKSKWFAQWQDIGFTDEFIKDPENRLLELSRYKVGDILWVRETYFRETCESDCSGRTDENECPFMRMGESCYGYKAQYTTGEGDLKIKWRPSIFMPKEACRLFLRVTAVRAERVTQITEEDAIREGCRPGDRYLGEKSTPAMTAKQSFMWLWQMLNSKRGYDWCLEPWVWVYTFERCDRPQGWPDGEG